jgi:hypothetical protein|nr:MAG TPA: hypothetical protein [Caudoviricetes sp.]
MKRIFEKWWDNDTKVFQINNYKKAHKEWGGKPRFTIHSNGAKKKNGDKCLDISIWIGYTCFNYIDWDLQN